MARVFRTVRALARVAQFVPDSPAVDFQLRFARAACPDPARLSRQVMPHPSETRQKILQLRELNLQSAFPAARPLRKNVENQLRSIEHLARE